MSSHLLYRPPRVEEPPPPANGPEQDDGGAREPRFRAVYAAAAIFLLGLVSNACWLFEVVALKGWEGLAWLKWFPVAAVPVSVCASVSTLVPVLRRGRVGALRGGVFIAGATLVSLTAFTLARGWFYSLNGKWVYLDRPLWTSALSPVLSVLVAALGLHLLARLLLARRARVRVSLLHALFVAIAVVATNGMAYLTIQIFPALGGEHDFIHAVKMGYPCFWVNILVGLATALSLRPSASPAEPD